MHAEDSLLIIFNNDERIQEMTPAAFFTSFKLIKQIVIRWLDFYAVITGSGFHWFNVLILILEAMSEMAAFLFLYQLKNVIFTIFSSAFQQSF